MKKPVLRDAIALAGGSLGGVRHTRVDIGESTDRGAVPASLSACAY